MRCHFHDDVVYSASFYNPSLRDGMIKSKRNCYKNKQVSGRLCMQL